MSAEGTVSLAWQAFMLAAAGLAVGGVLFVVQRDPRRRLGLVPFGATLLTVVCLAWGFHTALWQPYLLALLAGCGAGFAWYWWYAQAIEQFTEIVLWPIYRIRAYGPGKKTIPLRGPLLVVSNHTAWFDPLWLGKVIPRRIIPLMGSAFYDLPKLRWLMVYVVGAIRVQESGFRRDVPELDEAVQALDRGECVVIFPEGRVRRSAEVPLRQFGQGVWHILQRRPHTPVVVCWIEGGWGSYFSYLNGPPMRNKPFDFWRHIRIGVSAPQVLDPEVLAEHWATRDYLMRACLDARKHLGLESVHATTLDTLDQDEAEQMG